MYNPVLTQWIAADHVAELYAEAEQRRRLSGLRAAHPRDRADRRLGRRVRTSVTAWRSSLGLFRSPTAVGCETC